MLETSAPRPLAAVSLKAYLTQRQTLRWLESVGPAAEAHPGVEVAVLPLLTTLVDAGRMLGSAVSLGAQQISPTPMGAFTGEVPAAVLVELGVRYVEIGHAERRRHFGEGDDLFARQVAAALDAGLEPLICVGEPDRGLPQQAVAHCTDQLERLLLDARTQPIVVAYEPEWAIGAREPAPAEHVRAVLGGLRSWCAERMQPARLIYGGTAGPGTYASLAPVADGLFLGRRAHNAAALTEVLNEMGAVSARDGVMS